MNTADQGDSLWYKDAVVYQLHVKSFFDSNNDGIGDFAGLLSKLDYVADLGVTAIWLLPFYPSPRRDDGYDIASYCEVSTDYGTMQDVRHFIDEAHRRDIRVITELVINHTSDEHPWFQAARRAPAGSAARDYYVWSDSDETYAGTRIIFCDAQKSNWTWDEEAGAYYWHRFYSHQPDLNFDNPKVLDEVLSIMHFWLDTGVDGFRLDAIPYLIEREHTSNENLPETHVVLKRIRADLDRYYPDRLLLAEANMWPEDTQQYFGENGDECQMALHFPLMPRMYMAVAQEDRFPITDIMRQTPDIPDNCQWAIFLRNHDELTLEMVTDVERDYLWNTYASDRRARINLGIRRRLAPLLERDRRRVELMHAMLLTMRGTPILYYGDEIGMGDNIHLGDRDGVRTPMQWSLDRNGGFSRADPPMLTLPPIMDPLYGYQAVNVEAQERDSHSLLNWLKRMLAVRREFHVFGRGSQHFLRPANRKILAYVREYSGEASGEASGETSGETILCVANLARSAQAVELDLNEWHGRIPVELTGRTAFPPIGNLPYLLTFPPYGFSWFLLSEEARAPDWSSSASPAEAEQHTFVLREGLIDLVDARNRQLLERDLLPNYLAQRRWFGAVGEVPRSVRFLNATVMPTGKNGELLFTEIEVVSGNGTTIYALPLGIAWEGELSGPFAPNLALARVRRGASIGLLTDGFAVPAFAAAVVEGFRSGQTLQTGTGTMTWQRAEKFAGGEELEPEWIAAEQSNSTLILGRQVVVKLLRRIQPGIHPEAEMIRHLREQGFANVPPYFGEAVRRDEQGVPHVLLLAQAFVYNQGDAWQWTLELLSRLSVETDQSATDFENYESFARTLGLRLAEMHALLAQPSDDPAFAPERVSRAAAELLRGRVRQEIDGAMAHLSRIDWGDDPDRMTAEILLGWRATLDTCVDSLAAATQGLRSSRIHGDLHLGQVLITGSDVTFIDFEGQPAKSLAARRAKDLPLRDVAGVVRSFDYAAAVALRDMPAVAETAQERAIDVFETFRMRAVTAFLEGYGAVSGEAPGPLLDLFLIEKAAYELLYEAAHRPDWLSVPLAGLARIAARLAAGDAA